MDLIRIIADRVDVDVKDIKPESHIVEDLGADSLSIVEIIMDIEEEYDFTIDDDTAESLQTVQQMQDYINENTKCSELTFTMKL